MNLLRAAFLGCASFLMALSPSAREDDREFATSFCPQCWTFLTAAGSADREGTCRTCGRISVAVDGWNLTWHGCPVHDGWHLRPCPEGIDKGAPIRTDVAMVVSPGDERLRTSAYCPECRIHPDPMKTERGRCWSCQGPLVLADTIGPTWFWCSRGLFWRGDPCPRNATSRCCTARTGTVLAKVRSQKLD